jgi:hypothetical protein
VPVTHLPLERAIDLTRGLGCTGRSVARRRAHGGLFRKREDDTDGALRCQWKGGSLPHSVGVARTQREGPVGS